MALSEVEGEFDCAGKGEHSRRKELVQALFVASLLMEFALLGRVHMNVMVQISVPVVRQSFVFLMSVAHSHHSGYAWECKA